ncbi:MAG TPA: aspartyl protease family protein [Bryobacteraceae bacterium]|jgi:tetratricopeptide (TPR) repeat protein|nr:aspartyl protease family protein [Bryobacteraceae bacterium]
MFRRLVLFFAFTLTCQLLAQSDNGLSAYKDANFEAAIPLLETAHAQSPKDPAVLAALLSSLTAEDRVDRAVEIDQEAAAFGNVPEVLVARGEFAFHMGDMPGSEKLFKSALQLQESNARALFGLSRLFRAASYYRTSRLDVLKAHEIDPNDALITQAFLRYVPAEKRAALLQPFAAAHPWLYRRYQEQEENVSAIKNAVAERKLFAIDGPAQETTLKFALLLRDPHHAQGVGLDLKIGDGRPVRMLFDTGASGILLRQSAIDKAGLTHLGSAEAWGIGDAGTRKTFAAIADTCEIAKLRFRNCLLRGMEGKRAVAGDVDGLIGADFFQDYVVSIDFLKKELHLKPLPPRPSSPQGYDRSVPPDETGFTPVYRFGHSLMVSTIVNRKSTGLFLLDTGSEANNIDATFARLSTKIHGSDMHVQGVSGRVKQVYEASKGELQFAHFRQDNIGLIAIDLNNGPEPPTVRMSGILGLSVLQMFRLTIDYRNGLVNFDYVLK